VCGPSRPSAVVPWLARTWLIRAHRPAQAGAPRLVPPNWYACPLRTSTTPVFGSASKATSGTSRPLPEIVPDPGCQVGREKTLLWPPPLPSNQTVSLETAPVGGLRDREVPPTAVTLGSHAGCSTSNG